MVITALTRNQVALTGSWVRIPPPPPARRKRHIACDEFFMLHGHQGPGSPDDQRQTVRTCAGFLESSRLPVHIRLTIGGSGPFGRQPSAHRKSAAGRKTVSTAPLPRSRGGGDTVSFRGVSGGCFSGPLSEISQEWSRKPRRRRGKLWL